MVRDLSRIYMFMSSYYLTQKVYKHTCLLPSVKQNYVSIQIITVLKHFRMLKLPDLYKFCPLKLYFITF
jgi:hypothetical protein